MGSYSKILFMGGVVAFSAANALAQTYDLPIIFVDTKAKCLDNKVTEKIPATMRVLDAATNSVADSAKGTSYDIGIKVRGQSSALFPKPGYSVEVRDSLGEGIDVSMLGLPPADDWVFHGPYVDKSMMRNSLAHWLFRQAGRYSPRTMHFDLYINGVYRGVYVLIEKIKRGKYRVNVSKLKEEDISGDDVTGGYIWAFDKTGTNTGGAGSGSVNNEGFGTSDGLNVILHYPKKENIKKEQEDYLKNYLNDLEGLFKNGKNGNGYENYVDVSSAVDYVLHQEVTNNADSYWCSFFLHKPKDSKGGKVTLGPPWDFNLAMSNGSSPEGQNNNNGGWGGGFGGFGGMGGAGGFGSSGTTGWQIENSSKLIADGNGGGGMWGGFGGSSLKAPRWLTSMWKDSNYQSELKKRWAELRSGVWHTKTVDAYLDSMKIYLKNAANRNFERWPNLGKASGQNDADPQPMKYCNQSGGGFGMAMGGYNADTWDGEVEHLRKKMKERMVWMDEQLGFKEPADPIVTEPVIHIPVIEDKKDSVETPPVAQRIDYTRLSPTNYFTVNGSRLEIQTDIGGTFAIIDLKGSVLFKTKIKEGQTSMKIPAKARNSHWIATLNGKMLSR
ncbi:MULTISPECIES: CotH kinase family protein [unclassified Fibrobacter]|uniref:CotH kinase family protein n=1 Tax=unclassified Fibrobacter TaxID=2634177 RepID=UPI000D7B88AE|nr:MULTISPECIES: CotH kinase family protein [unclassified Fibrobacter]PWJ71796.1 CotH protein [Fibrobacter sp. UWR4]PZW73711.1 CotH protein [Fibrobacter sp. UWR1]